MRAILAGILFLAGCGGCVSIPTHADLRATALALEFVSGKCAGTAIGPDTFVTASHCWQGGALKAVNGQPVKVVGIGRDKHDLTVVRVKGVTFKAWARFGAAPKQGERVRWWGTPGGAPDMYREGYVAGFVEGRVLIDATICRGDSGSGIFNARGQVVGVVTAMNDLSGCTFMIAYPMGEA